MLKGKKFQDDPPYPSRWSGGQRDQGHGVVLHVHGEGYQLPITSRIWISQVPQGLTREDKDDESGEPNTANAVPFDCSASFENKHQVNHLEYSR